MINNILFDCFGARYVPHFGKSQTFKMAKKAGKNRTDMDIILLFLAKSLDKDTNISSHWCILLVRPYVRHGWTGMYTLVAPSLSTKFIKNSHQTS